MSLSPGDRLPCCFLAKINCHKYFKFVYLTAHKAIESFLYLLSWDRWNSSNPNGLSIIIMRCYWWAPHGAQVTTHLWILANISSLWSFPLLIKTQESAQCSYKHLYLTFSVNSNFDFIGCHLWPLVRNTWTPAALTVEAREGDREEVLTFQGCVRAVGRGGDRGGHRKVDFSPYWGVICIEVLSIRGGKTFLGGKGCLCIFTGVQCFRME